MSSPVKDTVKDPVMGTKITHPSFGMIDISRGVCTPNKNLFGTSFKHSNVITIDIHRAICYRGANRDSVHGQGAPIISIDMSPSQFADAITSLNSGGTPCTIHYMNGERIDEPLLESKRMQFDDEFREKMADITSTTNGYYTEIKKILEKDSIGKHDKENIMKAIEGIQMQLSNNVPFIKDQFTKQMDKTVLEAKQEVTAFIEEKLKRLGLGQYKEELKALEQLG